MKKFKVIICFLIFIILYSFNSFAGWEQPDGRWWYRLSESEVNQVKTKHSDKIGNTDQGNGYYIMWPKNSWWIINGALYHFNDEGWLDTNTEIDNIKLDYEGYALAKSNNRYNYNKVSASSLSNNNKDNNSTNSGISYLNAMNKVLDVYKKYKYNQDKKVITVDNLQFYSRADCSGLIQSIISYYLMKNGTDVTGENEWITTESGITRRFNRINITNLSQLQAGDVLIKEGVHAIVIRNVSGNTLNIAHMVKSLNKLNTAGLTNIAVNDNMVTINGNTTALNSIGLSSDTAKNYKVYRIKD